MFASLPVLVHGYTYPPGDDTVALNRILDFGRHNYYGHLPAAIVGMTAYYYWTPIFIFLGCYVLLNRYGLPTVCFAWISLFLINRTVLFDLYAGTFVGLINFYLLGFALLRLANNWTDGRIIKATALALASVVVFFHAFTGLLIWIMFTMHSVLFRKPPIRILVIPLTVAVLLSATFFDSSISRLRFWPGIAAAVVEKQSRELTKADGVEFPPLSFEQFIREYSGPGAVGLWALALIVVWNSWRSGWRPEVDSALLMLGLLLIPLAVMTFSPLAINGDRTAKMAVSILTLLSSVSIASALQFFRDKRLYAAIGVGVAFLLMISAGDNISYWLLQGSYR